MPTNWTPLPDNDKPSPTRVALSKAITISVGLAFWMVSSWAVTHTVSRARLHLASKNWPTVTGDVQYNYVSGRLLGLFKSIRYEYEVDGEEFSDEKMRLGQSFEVRDTPWRPGRSAGQTVEVHYDPDDHSVSALDAGFNLLPCLPPLLAAICFGLGWPFLFGTDLPIKLWRKLRGQPETW